MSVPLGTVAVGELPDGGWIGLAPAAAGYRVVMGAAGRSEPPGSAMPLPGDQRTALIALATVYFEEALPAPPPGTEEATHGEMASLVSWLAATAASDEEAGEARLALDAIEDGLPGDAVALRLLRMLELVRPRGDTAPEALELLLARVQAGG